MLAFFSSLFLVLGINVASLFHYFPFFLSISFFCPKVLHCSGEPSLVSLIYSEGSATLRGEVSLRADYATCLWLYDLFYCILFAGWVWLQLPSCVSGQRVKAPLEVIQCCRSVIQEPVVGQWRSKLTRLDPGIKCSLLDEMIVSKIKWLICGKQIIMKKETVIKELGFFLYNKM